MNRLCESVNRLLVLDDRLRVIIIIIIIITTTTTTIIIILIILIIILILLLLIIIIIIHLAPSPVHCKAPMSRAAAFALPTCRVVSTSASVWLRPRRNSDHNPKSSQAESKFD